MTCRAPSGSHPRESRHGRAAGCGGLLPSACIALPSDTPRREDAPRRTCSGSVAIGSRSVSGSPDPCRIVHTAWTPVWHAPHSTSRPSVGDSRGRNRGVWVSEASYSPPSGHYKSPRRVSPAKAVKIQIYVQFLPMSLESAALMTSLVVAFTKSIWMLSTSLPENAAYIPPYI